LSLPLPIVSTLERYHIVPDNGNSGASGPGLIILSGLPGTGKTTFARSLRSLLAFEHIETDALRRELYREPRYTPREHAAVFAAAEYHASQAIRAGRIALVDATNLQRSGRARFLRLARREGCPLVAVRVLAPDDAVRQRLSEPRGGHSQAGLGVFELMRGRAETFTSPVIVVDTRFSLGPSLRVVARLLKESAL
jgi:predicted kinase